MRQRPSVPRRLLASLGTYQTVTTAVSTLLSLAGTSWLAVMFGVWGWYTEKSFIPQFFLFLTLAFFLWMCLRHAVAWLWERYSPIEIGAEYLEGRAYLRVHNNRQTEKFFVKLTRIDGENAPRVHAPIRLPWKGPEDSDRTLDIAKRGDEWVALGEFNATRGMADNGIGLRTASYHPAAEEVDPWQMKETEDDSTTFGKDWAPIEMYLEVVAVETGRHRRVRVRLGAQFAAKDNESREVFMEATDLDWGTSEKTHRRSHYFLVARPGAYTIRPHKAQIHAPTVTPSDQHTGADDGREDD